MHSTIYKCVCVYFVLYKLKGLVVSKILYANLRLIQNTFRKKSESQYTLYYIIITTHVLL